MVFSISPIWKMISNRPEGTPKFFHAFIISFFHSPRQIGVCVVVGADCVPCGYAHIGPTPDQREGRCGHRPLRAQLAKSRFLEQFVKNAIQGCIFGKGCYNRVSTRKT